MKNDITIHCMGSPINLATHDFSRFGHKPSMNNISAEKAKLIEKHIKRLKKIHRKPICLAQGECGGGIGRSHTISKAMGLKYVAENDHVLVRQVNLFGQTENEVLAFKSLSINEALAFPGFCNQHDFDLFRCLDQAPFMATPEQLFVQAYRCACREYYFKACQIEAFLDANQIAELQDLPKEGKYLLSPELEIVKAGMSRGFADVAYHKEKFDNLLVNREFRRLQSYIIYSSSPPVIAGAGSFAPDFLSNGELLQDFSDFENNLQSLFVSVIPDRSGIFVVLSFFDDDAVAPTRFIKDLIAEGNLTHRIIWMCMTRIENLAARPSWWNGLSGTTRQRINEAVNYNADLFDRRLPTFDRMPNLEIEDWEVCYQFWN